MNLLMVILLAIYSLLGPGVQPVPELYEGILNDTNQHRSSRGLNALQYSLDLSSSAQERADYLCSSGEWSHDDWEDVIIEHYSYSRAAENLARGYQMSQVVEAWADSPSHERAMSGDFREVGFGYADCDGERFTVAHYGRKL